MERLLWISVALPIVAAAVVRASPRWTGGLAVGGAALAAIAACGLLVAAARDESARSGFTWLPAAPGLEAGLRLDGLSAAMSATVGVIGLAVIAHATGYFSGDARRRSALAGLLAFLGAMQGLVLADGYLTLLVFWELVGAASARLIAYNRDDPDAPPGAVRAFLTTRAADAGFYVAVIALYAGTETLNFTAERPDGALGALVAVGFVVAAVGKSAQAPLQTWLAGAMAGPTPVSALLHSATMVAAGVYLLARSHDLLAGWPLEAAGWIGALTAVAGAAIALAQDDLKRVLAGSTTSQLGIMFVGVAAGGPAVALFHLIAHAAGKAGLFLAAGVFQHQRGGTRLRDLGGAGRDDRGAFTGFAIGALSIAAVPPLAGFWSKDHIAAAAEQAHAAWFVFVLIAAAGSAAYLLRPALVLWRGGGRARSRHENGRTVMVAAVLGLAAASLVLALAGEPLVELLDAPALPASTASLLASLGALVIGAGAVLLGVKVAPALRRAAARQFFAADAQRLLVQRPVLAASSAVQIVESRVLDRVVDGAGRAGLRLARIQDRIELAGIDRAVDGLARLVGWGGERSSRLQSGRLYEYLRDAALGAGAVSLLIALSAVT